MEGHESRAVTEATAHARKRPLLQQHVVRLDIAVDEAMRVDKVKRVAHLDYHLSQANLRSAAPATGALAAK